MNTQKTYLSDGVYAERDGFHVVVLTTQRGSGEHMIALDDDCIYAMFRFIERTCGVKITMDKVKDERQEEFDSGTEV